MQTKKMKLQPGQMRAAFQPTTFDAQRNTMEVVWTTGARVKRSSFWDGDFYEELSMKKGDVQLERLNKGAPLLNNHGSGNGLRDILGVIVQGSAFVKGDEGHATVQFSGRSDVKELIEDIKSGVIPNLSVGYRVHEFSDEEEAEDGLPILRAVSWEPFEISFVTIPADMHAQARNHAPEANEVIIQRKQGEIENMKKKTKTATAVRSPGHPVHTENEEVLETPAKNEEVAPVKNENESEIEQSEPALEALVDESTQSANAEEHGEHEGEHADEEAFDADEGSSEKVESGKTGKKASGKSGKGARAETVEEIRSAEIERGDSIRKHVRLAGLPETFADDLVKNTQVSAEDAGKRIFAELEKRSSTPTINQRVEVKEMEQRLLRRQAAVRGLLHRFDSEKYKLKQDGDQEYRHDSLIDAARFFLHKEGVNDAFSMSRTQVAERALHTTSDFSAILADTANVTLREGYDSVPNTYEEFTKKKSVSDFRDISSVEISNGGRLEQVNEHGEYRRTSLVEGSEKYRLTKFGIVIGRTFELIVNDKLGALTDIPNKLGQRAREKENQVFWSLILSNPIMSDGFAFFSTQHGNLGTGGPVGVASVGEARAKQRTMRDLDGELIAGLTPEWLVTPAALETTSDQFLAPISPVILGQANPFTNKLKGMTEPLLDANSLTAYYLFASKARAAIAEMSLLDNRGPEIFTREGFDIDGQETKVRYIFGMGLINWRGAFKNNGQ